VPYDAEEAYGERAAGYEDMRRRVPDASKLFAHTGFRPSIALDQTLREIIDYELTTGAIAETRGSRARSKSGTLRSPIPGQLDF
jgi:hypothetical protein